MKEKTTITVSRETHKKLTLIKIRNQKKDLDSTLDEILTYFKSKQKEVLK